MKPFKPPFIANILKEEMVMAKGSGRLLLIAMGVNIPFWGFMPYLTQAITIIVLAFFLKKQQRQGIKIPLPLLILILATMAFQLLWFPFVSQLVTLFMLGLIYVLVNK
jgi:hypothetical protein